MRIKAPQSDHLNMLYRQLAAMTASGMTVSEAISALAGDSDDSPISGLIATMNSELKSGKSPGEVVTLHLQHLKGLPAAVLGQEPADASRFFTDLAEFSEKRQQLKRFLVLSLIYPALVASILLFVISLLMIVVIPMLSAMFADMGGTLPLPTRIVVALSRFISSVWYLIPAGIVALILIFRYRRQWLLTAADNVPFVKGLNRKIACAELVRNLALLAKCDIPAQEKLQTAAASISNEYYAHRFSEIALNSRDLTQFVTQLRQAGLLSAIVSHTVRAGERSKALASALYETARFTDYDTEKTFNRFVLLLYPLTIILLGIVVGFCVIAMYMPIFQMGSMAG